MIEMLKKTNIESAQTFYIPLKQHLATKMKPLPLIFLHLPKKEVNKNRIRKGGKTRAFK